MKVKEVAVEQHIFISALTENGRKNCDNHNKSDVQTANRNVFQRPNGLWNIGLFWRKQRTSRKKSINYAYGQSKNIAVGSVETKHFKPRAAGTDCCPDYFQNNDDYVYDKRHRKPEIPIPHNKNLPF